MKNEELKINNSSFFIINSSFLIIPPTSEESRLGFLPSLLYRLYV